ncbi:hypothetical protein [Microseira wollei]|uniref:Uncharacterized protein n=1 Tax=Microseira wollei NIES-4236 TaxID=2530354 RepID=A0AAV3XJR3_9CYAN|nr:hypothetical protein [Microseira wollei]GET42543.1 hypothetical protein MiSe_73610 [Microseira wollei NIES-4236]
MVLTSNHPVDLTSSSLPTIPDSLKVLLTRISQQHYEELYEPEADGTTPLPETLSEILEAFQNSDRTLCHLRYIWMALILALLVEPTLEYYQPSNSFPKSTVNWLVLWLLKNIDKIINDESQNTSYSKSDELLNQISETSELSARKDLVSFQVLNEALDVFHNALRVLDYDQSVEALLEILDDCLEGYAVFPGSKGRRELFDWWVLEVVPASWYLLPPKSFYVVQGLQNKEEVKLRQTNLLQQISSVMWLLLRESSSSKIETKSQRQYTLSGIAYTNKVKMDNELIRGDFNSSHNLTNREKNERVVCSA